VKKLLTLTMITLMLVAFGVTQAEAANTATIGVTVTLTAGALEIVVSPADWAIGELAASGTKETTPDVYTVTNNTTNATVDLSIQSGNSANWTAKATAGAEEFVMKAELEGGALAAIDTSKTLKLFPSKSISNLLFPPW